MTYCPECKYPQHCGCSEFCRSKIPEGIKPVIWTEDGEAIICPNCGFIGSADFWLDEEIRQLEEKGIFPFRRGGFSDSPCRHGQGDRGAEGTRGVRSW